MTSINPCKDCKWWSRLGDSDEGMCNLVDEKGSPVTVGGEFGYRGWMWTQENFGCIKWEARGEESNSTNCS